MKKWLSFGLVALFFISFVGLAAGCNTSTKSEEFSGDLVAFKLGVGTSNYYSIFVKGRASPIYVGQDRVNFLYNSQIDGFKPRVEAWKQGGWYHAKIYFRDEDQFREYLR